jgi:DNA polymerase III alpha subunit
MERFFLFDQVIEGDKDDIDALKFMKVDVLGLGMLGCMRRAFDLLATAKASSSISRPFRPKTRRPTP